MRAQKEIFINNKERYGYRRITLELKNQGYNVNHKKVYRIMILLGLKPLKRNNSKEKENSSSNQKQQITNGILTKTYYNTYRE